MRLAVATFVVFLAFASPAFASGVTDVNLVNAAPSAAAGARTTYVVEFRTSAGGAMSGAQSGEVLVTLPQGAAVDGWNGGELRNASAQQIGSCGVTGLQARCWLNANATAGAGQLLTATLRGVANPTTPGSYGVTVSTTADTDSVPSPMVPVSGAQPVTKPTVAIGAPSDAAGAQTSYVVRLAASSTGGLAGTARSEIYLTLPDGTTAPNWNGGDVFDITRNDQVGSCTAPTAARLVVCWIHSGDTVNAGDQLRITLNGVTNPSAGVHELQARTTTDTPTIVSNPYPVVSGHSVTKPTVAIGAPSDAAGAQTSYVVRLAASSTGGLAGTARSEIYLTLPDGTTAPNWNGGDVFDITRNDQVGSCTAPTAARLVVCWIHSGDTVNAGDQLRITLNGVTNPSAGVHELQARTTTDTPTIVSNPYPVVSGHSVTKPTVAIGAPSDAAGAQTSYVVRLAASSTGGLAGTARSEIYLTLPDGTTAPNWNGGDVFDITRNDQVGSCTAPTAARLVVCWIHSGDTVNAGDQLRITLNGVTNPSAGVHELQARTTTDTPTIVSNPYPVVSGQQLTNVTVRATTTAPQAAAQYVISLKTSSVGGLAGPARSEVHLTLPDGTTAANWSGSVYDVDRATTVGSCNSPTPARLVVCWIHSGATINGSDVLRITLNGVRNPPTAPPYTLTVTSTSDRPTVTSASYAEGDTEPPDTTVGAPSLDGARATFTFGSPDAGVHFECRIDGGAFTPCTSPHTTAPLAEGPHLFFARAVDAAGNPDLTPAGQEFNVGVVQTPTPTPTETPSPTPTAVPTTVPTAVPEPTPTATPPPVPVPEFGQTVVVKPVRGTVRVRRPGSNEFVDLDASAGVPLGATIDTRKGEIELTSVSAAGATPQTARFREGMFRISQSASTTDLTLNEPLAPCSQRARAAAKKPKSRRLWGDGKGQFRTVGSHAAATVRGTEWMVQDTCAGTLVRVKEGVVSVRDKVKRRTVTVRAPGRYTARRR